MGERDEQNMKMMAGAFVEAVKGGFIVQRPAIDYCGPGEREVVHSVDGLVAVVQRWAKDATER